MPPIRTITFVNKNQNESEIKAKDPIFVLACFFFGLSIFTSILAFSYGKYLEYRKNTLTREIQSINNEISKYNIQELIDFAVLFNRSKELIENRTFMTTLLTLLSESVENDIYYTSFDFNINSKGESYMNLSGIGNSYESVARQISILKSKNFNYDKVVQKVKFDKISTNRNGKIVFSLNVLVKPNVSQKEANFLPRVGNGLNILPITDYSISDSDINNNDYLNKNLATSSDNMLPDLENLNNKNYDNSKFYKNEEIENL